MLQSARQTILTRLKSNRETKTVGKGNVSLLLALEAHFLVLGIILQLAVIHQPVTPSGAILIVQLVETSHFI